jgi:hypothetical protein
MIVVITIIITIITVNILILLLTIIVTLTFSILEKYNRKYTYKYKYYLSWASKGNKGQGPPAAVIKLADGAVLTGRPPHVRVHCLHLHLLHMHTSSIPPLLYKCSAIAHPPTDCKGVTTLLPPLLPGLTLAPPGSCEKHI